MLSSDDREHFATGQATGWPRNMKYTAPRMQRAAQRKSRRSGCFMYKKANGTNTARVIASCMILSWPSESAVYPIRLAGTCNRYSNSAIPQLTNAATSHGRPLRFFRCAYYAKVMNTFERTSRPAVRRMTVMRVMRR